MKKPEVRIIPDHHARTDVIDILNNPPKFNPPPIDQGGSKDLWDRLYELAKELTEIRCSCSYSWTSRGRHDPHGCTWEDAEKLREAVKNMELDRLTTPRLIFPIKEPNE